MMAQALALQAAKIAHARASSLRFPWPVSKKRPCGICHDHFRTLRAEVAVGCRRLHISSRVEPRYDVGEHHLNVLVRLARCEAVPHPRVQLHGLVRGACSLVQRPAHLRIGHRVCLAVQHEERQCHLHNIQ